MKPAKTQVGRADMLRLLAANRTASMDVAARMLGYERETPRRVDVAKTKLRKVDKSGTVGTAETAADAKPAGVDEISRKLPPERFWYLRRREKLQGSPSRLLNRKKNHPPLRGDSDLPDELRDIEPLRAAELNCIDFSTAPYAMEEAGQHAAKHAAVVQPSAPEPHSIFNASPGASSMLSRRTPVTPEKAEKAVAKPDITGLVSAIAQFHPLRPLLENGRIAAAERERLRTNTETTFRNHIRRLLGLLSVAAYVEPPLLQAIFQLLPSSRSDAETEAAVRTHPDVLRHKITGDKTTNDRTSRFVLAFRPEKKAKHRRVFALEDPDTQANLLRILLRYRSVHAPALFVVELLDTFRFLHPSDKTTKYLDWSKKFLLRFVRTWFDRRNDSGIIQYADRVLHLLRRPRRSPEVTGNLGAAPSFLYGIAHRDRLRAGARIPQEYQPESVMRIAGRIVPTARYLLVQQGERIVLVSGHDGDSVPAEGSLIADLDLSVDCLLLRGEEAVESLPIRPAETIYSLKDTSDGFRLQTPVEKLYISTCFRPSWATAIGRNRDGLFADTLWLGAGNRLIWRNPHCDRTGYWGGGGNMRTDQYGLYADLEIADGAAQRFRWIEPGWFMMGSPMDEPERESWGKESLHEVILTKGFWMADTAVTQRVWRAVMEHNPSRFKGDELPVENVSWHDARQFIKKLKELSPDLAARLPTEAEWEYTCRAGTHTPFSFGERITPKQVNYNGHYPYNAGITGRNRKRTVAVKSLPRNDWGLYEMHGNVWEWCQDCWQNDLYSDEPGIDPQGPETGDVRTVRGGSWLLNGRGVRSAIRGKFVPDFRNSRTGFRLALSQENHVP
jgi:formylglycine-generating enzyme required for sulfatase activity